MPSNYEIWREGNGLSEPGDAGWCLGVWQAHLPESTLFPSLWTLGDHGGKK